MPELFSGPTTDFLTKASNNVIAEELRRVFQDYYGFPPPDAEVRSWRDSLRALSGAIRLGGFLDHGMLLEYQLPLSSKRLDAMITGEGHDGRPAAVIVELKQWDDVEPSLVPECVGVRYGGRIQDKLHPSAQVGQYCQYLADVHTSFHPGGIKLDACSFLHDFIHDEGSELLSTRHANILGVYPLFAGDRVDDLVQYLTDRIGGGKGFQILRTVRDGRYQPHKKYSTTRAHEGARARLRASGRADGRSIPRARQRLLRARPRVRGQEDPAGEHQGSAVRRRDCALGAPWQRSARGDSLGFVLHESDARGWMRLN